MQTTTMFAPSAAAMQSYRMRPVTSAVEWGEYFHALPQAHLMQSYPYGEAKRAAERLHVERYVFEQGRTPVAICQVLERRLAGVRVGARINRGPVFLDSAPSYGVREGVMKLVRMNWRTGRGGPLLIAPALPDSEENRTLLRSLGFRCRRERGWCSSLIDLGLSEEEIRKRLSSSWRNHLKGAMKSGLELRVSQSDGSYQWMVERHQENMRAKGFAGPKPDLLLALHAADPNEVQVLQALHQDRPVAGMILARFGHTVEHYVGWFGPEGRKLQSGNYLYWQAICESKKAGYRWFDVGGYDTNDKFGHFKMNMRGHEYRLAGEWLGL
ncbi:MAG TPA: GNAT family N-acetyltransferase [Noviherbaspirillum sp.]|nr:GNAT family N-acetyltransferase [Noviherbaspirillum sp.]